MKKIIIILVTLFIAACGSDNFEGEYISKPVPNNPLAALFQQKLSFTSDGKVSISVAGNRIGIFKYEKDGDEITLFRGDGTTQLFTLEDDGSLLGGGAEYIEVSRENDSRKKDKSEPAEKSSHNITGKTYVWKDPNFKPEYADVAKLFFTSDSEVKFSLKQYDAGAFQEHKKIFKYTMDGDKITLFIDGNTTQTLTVQENGNLFNNINKAEYIKLDN